MPRSGRRIGWRAWLVVSAVLGGLLTGLGYAAVSAAPMGLGADGPTAVSGTEASAVFMIGDRTIRQVRYSDGATLVYTFRLLNSQALPMTIRGISPEQAEERLFSYVSLKDDSGRTRFTVPGNGAVEVNLRLKMGGCESLSARAGSFAHRVSLVTGRLGVSAGTATILLPEEIHTGSPREAFCPNSTAKSRPPG